MMSGADDGHSVPPGGSIGSILGEGGPSIPPGLDVRKRDTPFPRPMPMGPTYAVDVQEILKRGFQTLDENEKASVIASYLATQKQQLSPYLTPFDEEMARNKHSMELSKSSDKRTIKWVGLGVLGLVLAAIGYGLFTVGSKGVMTDSGNIRGLMSMAQEIIRVIFGSNSF